MANLVALVRGGIAAFFAWWLGELAGLVPRRFRRAARRERRGAVLAFDRTGVTVLERTASGERVLGSVTGDDSDRDRRLGELLKQARRPGRAVTVRLSGELGLRKVLDLPLAARDDLDQMLRLEMDRLTPFRAEEVYFAYRVLASDAQARRLTVELQLAPRREVERALEAAHAIGVVPAAVQLTDGGLDAPLDLLAGESGHKAREGRLTRVLALLALALAIAAVVIPLQRQRASLAALEAKVTAAQAQAEESLALRTRLERLTRSAEFLVADKTRQPMVVAVLDELTRLLPDQAYIIQLGMHDGTVELHGYATTASDLIGLLEQSPLFRAPQFRSPVTQDPRSGTERFHVSVELMPEEGG
jgi:general secretion pathway protein L